MCLVKTSTFRCLTRPTTIYSKKPRLVSLTGARANSKQRLQSRLQWGSKKAQRLKQRSKRKNWMKKLLSTLNLFLIADACFIKFKKYNKMSDLDEFFQFGQPKAKKANNADALFAGIG